jgi:fumarate hydratase class II
MRPVIIKNFLHSAQILADGCTKFREYSVEGTEINPAKIQEYVNGSVMLVTALSPVIGYQNAAHIAEEAIAKGLTLKQAALSSGKVDEALFDKTVRPIDMVGSGLSGA